MQYITIFDYLLLPVYLYIFYFIVRKRSIKYTDPEIRKFFITAFLLRMGGSVGYSMLVQYYYGFGDTFTFYYGSNFLRENILSNFDNIKYFFKPASEVKQWYDFQEGNINYSGYFGIASNLLVMKVSAIISFLSFNRLLIISLFFGFFSFAGQWRLYTVFNTINEGKYQKLMAWAVLYMPSIWFWGSGLMKDALCLGILGFIIHYLYKIFILKNIKTKDLLILVFLVYFLSIIKSYAVIVLAVSLLVFTFFNLIYVIKNVVLRIFFILTFVLLSSVFAFVVNFNDQLQELALESKAQADSFKQNYEYLQNLNENSKATIGGEEIDASLTGLILYSPKAIFTCMFRPFPWESRKIMILLTSFESMLLLVCTLFLILRFGFFNFLKTIFSNRYLLFALTMSMLFAVIIGFTTYNFGTIVRYKTILLPFYMFMLVGLYSIYTDPPVRGETENLK